MLKRTLAAVVVAVLAPVMGSAQTLSGQVAAAAAPQSQASGQQFVVKIDMQKAAGADAQDANNPLAMAGQMFRQMMLPDGAVEMAVMTDGQSVRTELRGRWLTMPSGTVMLKLAGQANAGYVLNPADKTYYVLKTDAVTMPELPNGMTLPKPEVSVKPGGTFETIAGYRAEKVDVSWRMAIPIPEGVDVPPGLPTDVSLAIEMWCAPDLKMPEASGAMATSAIAKMMPGMGFDQIMNSCSFPLRSRMRLSMMPGYEMLTTVTPGGNQAPSPDLFKIPAGYKEVPMPAPRLPGIGDEASGIEN
jgi:hypothetical protein